MVQNKTTVNAQWVAKTFENIFSDKFDLYPSKLGMGKYLITDLGLESLDVLEILMETERRMNISFTDAESDALFRNSTIGDILHACIKKLIALGRVSTNDAQTILVNYSALIMPHGALSRRTQRMR